MTGAEIALAIGVPFASGTLAFAVSWGYMRGEKQVFVTHPDHRVICHDRAEEIYSDIKKNYTKTQDQYADIMRALGRIEGKLEKQG